MTAATGRTSIAAAVAHLGFCERVAARWRRVPASRARAERVFARIPSGTDLQSSLYAPVFATTIMAASRIALTLAPSIRIDLHSIAAAASQAPRPRFQETNPIGATILLRSAPRTSPVSKVVLPTPGDSWLARVEPRLAPLLRQVIERRHREDLSLVKHVVSSIRRSEVRRLETIVRQSQAPTVPQTAQTAGAGPQYEPRKEYARPSRPTVPPARPLIHDAEVARLTDRVVEQINRRILAERERRGKT